MKKIIHCHTIAFVVVFVFICGCKKNEVQPVVSGTVVQINYGCKIDDCLLLVDQQPSASYPFLCSDTMLRRLSSVNCYNHVFVENLPKQYQTVGKRIQITKWKDNGIACQSSTNAPHHLQVIKVAEQ